LLTNFDNTTTLHLDIAARAAASPDRRGKIQSRHFGISKLTGAESFTLSQSGTIESDTVRPACVKRPRHADQPGRCREWIRSLSRLLKVKLPRAVVLSNMPEVSRLIFYPASNP